MLHLLPIRYLLILVVALCALSVLAAVYAGYLGQGEAVKDVVTLLRWSLSAASGIGIAAVLGWRWIGLLQRHVFPYVGGKWEGHLLFDGPNGTGRRDITLKADHSLFNIRLILDSDESTSRTLVVHAERDRESDRDRLYYVYMNERKEGVPGSGERYRGLAVMRIEEADGVYLKGDYFTEVKGVGHLELRRVAPHKWWQPWK